MSLCGIYWVVKILEDFFSLVKGKYQMTSITVVALHPVWLLNPTKLRSLAATFNEKNDNDNDELGRRRMDRSNGSFKWMQ